MKTNFPTVFRRSAAQLAVAVFALGLMLPSLTNAAQIVDHPEELTYEELDYVPPAPADYRHALKNGTVAFVAENPEVPTLQVSVLVRTGSIYEPVEKAGLADMTGYLMRNGGVEGMTSKELDQGLAQLAGTITVDMSDDRGRVELFCLSKDADAGLAHLKSVLKSPVFEQEALDRYRKDVLSDLEQRNANAGSIEAREWQFLIYGDHPSTNAYRRTAESVSSITREDLMDFHRKHFFPGNFIFAVSGQLETGDILARLDDMLADWPDESLDLPAIPDQIADPAPGVYIIEKEDVNQSRIRLGHVGVRRDVPDQYALSVMNDILGGGGFTSRIVRRVRSDEGLAYSVGSAFDRPILYPGTFRAWFQTKHATAAFGTDLIVTEIERIRTEKCENQVVENAKASFISNVVNPFSNRDRIVNTFADDLYTGRDDGYWQEYTENMKAVTADDVLAVAKKYLHPDKLVFLVVGDAEAVEAGSDKHDQKYSDFGDVTILPLRDPVTLKVE